MKYSISDIINKIVKYKGRDYYPLKEYQKLNKLDIITIEEYLDKYNPNRDQFSLNELVTKLENNCTLYGIDYPSGEAQVAGEYIKEKITLHYTEYTSKTETDETFPKRDKIS